jgi:shikimate dehydrogenase
VPGTPLKLALFGHPVAHSRSPEVHAEFGRQTGIALTYEAIDVPSATDGARAIKRALDAFVAGGGRGANVTLPFKRDALALCATLGDAARRAGAVNVLVVDAGGAVRGENTDGSGLVRDLVANRGIALAGRRVALLGASGAARGAAVALLGAGVAAVAVANRDQRRAEGLARDLGRDATRLAVRDYAALAAGGYDLVVNATSASLAGELPPLPEGVLAPGGVAYDMVYADAPTPFQRWATDQGARLALDGWGMMVEQAADSFALWTGVRPDTRAVLGGPR